MTTINLHQSQQENSTSFSANTENKGFIFSLGILVATLLIFAGLKLYVPYAERKSEALADTVVIENDKLVGLKSLEQVVDMQKRLTEIKSNLQLKDGKVNRLEMTKLLDYLASDMNPSVVVSDFKYSGDNVTVSFNANSFDDLAKQILNFKKSDHFSEVGLSSMIRNERVISAVVAMKIKK